MPERLQLSRRKGARLPDGAVNVARPSRWGNPWRVGETGIPNAAEAVRRFRAAVIGFESEGRVAPPTAHPDSYIGRIICDAPTLLRGKDLACWCARDQPCHADVLLEIANKEAAQP